MNVALLLLGAATAVRDDAAVAARGETFAEHAASRAAVQHERCGGWVARRAARGREKAPVVYERAPTGLADAPSGEELAISWRRTSRRRETRAVERLATVRTVAKRSTARVSRRREVLRHEIASSSPEGASARPVGARS